jgi:hypothetical protein
MGSNQFCIKICNPSGANPEGYCQHKLDRLGCSYNAPSKFTVDGGSADTGVFETCNSDNMDIPGEYVQNGQTRSYAQPPESAGPIKTVPYEPRIPATSNCVQTASTALYTDIPHPSPTKRSSPMKFKERHPNALEKVSPTSVPASAPTA